MKTEEPWCIMVFLELRSEDALTLLGGCGLSMGTKLQCYMILEFLQPC